MTYNFIKTKIEKNVFYLTLARPDKRNAFTPTMVNEINHAIDQINSDKNVRLLIINALGPVFCAGMDLKVFQNPELDNVNPDIENKQIALSGTIAKLNKPSIAIVEGDVIAGGFLIVCECNYVFAKSSAKFSLPEVKRGLFPFQVLASLLKHMPENQALDLCITGKTISAEKAQALNLVYEILPENYDPTINNSTSLNALIETISNNAPLAISMGLAAAKHLKKLPEIEKLNYLRETLQILKNSDDAKEGALAFFEKRDPVWQNC